MSRRQGKSRRKQEDEDLWELWNTRLRGLGLWFLGAWGVYNELLIRTEDIRLPALGIYGFFLGLPFANLIDGFLAAKRENGEVKK